jgi:two-component system sensor histidine kinase BarA
VALPFLRRGLDELSVETKFRLALGVAVLTLMSLSFWLYARQAESLAYDQLTQTGRALVGPAVTAAHVPSELRAADVGFQELTEQKWPEGLKRYSYRLLRPDGGRPETAPAAGDLDALAAFKADPGLAEATSTLEAERTYLYYGAVRAGPTCVACHRDAGRLAETLGVAPSDPAAVALAAPALADGELMAVVRVQLSTDLIRDGLHVNRAVLIGFAVGTTLAILASSYVIVRYLVVRPVRHLKDVADAIAAGGVNLRAEVQTGDEFEDFAEAFNRMLRNLTEAEGRNRKLIDTLAEQVDKFGALNLALNESNRLKGDFLSTMSHELRTPLNSIIGFSEILVGDDRLTDKQARYAGNIMTSGRQLLVLINDILDLAKAEAGQLKLRLGPVSLPARCEEVAGVFRPAAEARRVELHVAAEPHEPGAVSQDAGKLRQVVSNLVSNAIKFTPEGGRVTVSAATTDGRVTLAVADTGVGIAPAEQAAVFDKFRQASNPLTREQGGTGLGLSIVRELCKLLGGTVELRSDLGRGSTFTVTLPARLREWPADPTEEPADAD